MIHVLAGSVFPVIFRGTALGFIMIVGLFSSVLSPILAELNDPIPMILFIIFSSLVALTITFTK